MAMECYGSIPLNPIFFTFFFGLNIHKSQLFFQFSPGDSMGFVDPSDSRQLQVNWDPFHFSNAILSGADFGTEDR